MQDVCVCVCVYGMCAGCVCGLSMWLCMCVGVCVCPFYVLLAVSCAHLCLVAVFVRQTAQAAKDEGGGEGVGAEGEAARWGMAADKRQWRGAVGGPATAV